MRIFLKDVRYAWRALFKRPLLTATVAGTLALGLGANAAIFNLIDRLVLRPYPFADPDRAVMLAETGPRLDFRKESVSPANFLDWRASADTMTHSRRIAVVGREPRRARRSRAAAGLPRVVGILRRARHPAGARPRLRARRRDLRPPSRRRPQRRAVEAAVRRRSGDRRPQRHHRRRAAPGRGRGAAALRLPRRRGDLGAARVRSAAAAAAATPLPDRHRTAAGRARRSRTRRRRWR